MNSNVSPIIGQWYHFPEKRQKFMVTAIDDHDGTVEIQYFDGAVDELMLTTWYAMNMECIEAPEDWTGPMNNIEKDDLNPVGTEMQRGDWDAPFDENLEKEHASIRNKDRGISSTQVKVRTGDAGIS